MVFQDFVNPENDEKCPGFAGKYTNVSGLVTSHNLFAMFPI